MNFNKFLKSLFGDKSTRDMKLIQPLVEKVKAVSPQIEQLDNDALRQRSKEIREQVQAKATEQRARIAELKGTIENTPIDERADIFAQIDKIEKEILDIFEKALAQPQTSIGSWLPIPERTSSPSTVTRPSTTTTGRLAAMT